MYLSVYLSVTLCIVLAAEGLTLGSGLQGKPSQREGLPAGLECKPEAPCSACSPWRYPALAAPDS